jgi:hypothetical protein
MRRKAQDLYGLDSNEVNVLDAASPIEVMFGPMSVSERASLLE